MEKEKSRLETVLNALLSEQGRNKMGAAESLLTEEGRQQAIRGIFGRSKVSDTEIKDSLEKICKQGFYIEPTSASTIAGVKKYAEKHNGENIVSVFTGHGLKTTEKMLKLLGEK